MGVTGKDFCQSSADALALISANPVRYNAVGVVGYILAIVGKLTISALTTFLFYMFITFVISVKANIIEPIYLVIMVAIGSFAIGYIFTAIFDVAVDTLLACFLIDQQANGKALYATPKLTELISLMEE